MKTLLSILLLFTFSLSYCQQGWQRVSAKFYYQDSLRAKKQFSFDGPIRMLGPTYIGSTLVISTGTELNRLSGLTVDASSINHLSDVRTNVQDQLDNKAEVTNTRLFAHTVVDQLQIGTSDDALLITGLENIGEGLVVRDAEGNQVPYNNPAESTVSIWDIAVMQGDEGISPNDTTVTKRYGRIVFREADSTFYGCRFIRPTGKKCWFPLN